MSAIAAAYADLVSAELDIVAAERDRDEASAALDAALHERGWVRMAAGLTPDAEPLYQNAVGEAFGRGAIVEYELERAAA